ncbi:MAG: carboxypeptidase regulatory-like domain-containing protein [Planctomycetes bacterium]|nr:carboxypeptidase regulatory-like domain-containing protein [Planctomycetota bacterium]
MKIKLISALLLLQLFICTPLNSAVTDQIKPQPPINEAPGTFWGKVKSKQSNQIISGANISLSRMHTHNHFIKSISDGGGNIFFNKLKEREGEDFLICRHPDFATFGLCHIDSQQYDESDPYTIKMSTGHGAHFEIVSSGNTPLSGANITLSTELKGGSCAHDFPYFENTITNLKGIAQIPQLKKGNYTLSVNKEGWVCPEKPNIDHKSLKSYRVVMEKAQDFTIDFLDRKGLAAPDVNFAYCFTEKLVESKKAIRKTKKYHAEAKDTARATIASPEKGFLHVQVDTTKYSELTKLNIPLKGSMQTTLSLIKKQLISGRVISSENGEGIVKAEISYKYRSIDDASYLSESYMATDSKGHFKEYVEARNISPMLKLTHIQHQPLLHNMEKGKSENLEIEMSPGTPHIFTVYIEVPHSDPAIIVDRKAEITIESSRGSFTESIHINSSGQFSLKCLTKGDFFEISIDGMGKEKIAPDWSTHNKDIVLKAATLITLDVKDTQGNLVKNIWASVMNGSSSDSISVDFQKESNTYLIDSLKAGEHELKIQSSDYLDKEISIAAEAGEAIFKKVILEKKPIIEFELKNHSGEVPKDIRVIYSKGRYNNHTRQARRVKEEKDILLYRLIMDDPDNDHNQVKVIVNHYLPTEIDLEPDKKPQRYLIKLIEGLSLKATIMNQEDQPLEGVSVTIHKEHNYQEKTTAKSDTSGKVKMSGLKKGRHTVRIRLEGYTEKKIDHTITDGENEAQWTMSKGGKIIGTILDTNQIPVDSVNVSLQRQNEWGSFQSYHHGNNMKTSDEKGHVEFSNINHGNYRISVSDPDKGMGNSDLIVIKNNEAKSLELTLEKGLAISGIITDEKGNPLPEINISAHQPGLFSQRQNNLNTESDYEGKFRIAPVTEGSFLLNANHEDYESSQKEYSAKGGATDIVIQMKQSPFIALNPITPMGEKAIGVKFYMRSEKHAYESELHEVNETASGYTIRQNKLNLDPTGSFSIIAKAKGYNPGRSEILTKENIPEKIDIQLQAEQSIIFRCVNEFGESIKGISVNSKYESNEGIEGRENFSTRSNSEGLLTLSGIPLGLHDFTFTHDNYSPLRCSHEVSEDSSAPIELIFNTGATLKVRVLDKNGEAIAAAQVMHRAADDQAFSRNSTQKTDDEGWSEFLHLAPGKYTVTYSRNQLAWNVPPNQKKEVQLSTGATEEVIFQESSSINMGKVIATISGETQYMMATLIKKSMASTQYQAKREANKFVFERIPEGNYTFMTFSGQKIKKQDLRVEPGKTTEIVIEDHNAQAVKAKVLNKNGEALQGAMAILLDLEVDEQTLSNPMKAMEAMIGMGMIEMGAMEIQVDQPGTYTLYIQSHSPNAGVPLTLKNVTINEGQILDLGELHMKKGITFSGHVLDENNNGIKGARLMITKDNIPQNRGRERSSKDGSFSLSDAPDFPFLLTTTHKDYSSSTLMIEANNKNITLPKGVSLTLQILGGDFSGKALNLMNEDGTMYNQFAMGMNSLISVDESNQASLSNIAPGWYKIQIESDNGDIENIRISELFQVTRDDEALINVNVPLSD